MRRFHVGQNILIIGASHSGPTTEMYDMVGTVQTINEVYDEDNYKIRGYIWSYKDLSLPTDHKPADKSAKQFDVKNLVV